MMKLERIFSVRTTALTSASLMAISIGGNAASAAEPVVAEEIVVTGTRVVRDGYEAPTPLTVVGVEALQNAASANVADFVNTLPSLAGSQMPQTSQASVSSGLAGLNTLNLRNLGSNRTLVLL